MWSASAERTGLSGRRVLADPSAVDDEPRLAGVAADLGARLLVREVRLPDGSARHDPLRLAAAYRDVFEGVFEGG